MTHDQFYAAVSEVSNYTDRGAYVSDLALSSMWGDDADSILISVSVGMLWDAWHMSVKELRAVTGLSQAAFARRFLIPRRTVENWESTKVPNECPLYIRMLIADVLGLLPARTEDWRRHHPPIK